jgi:hypothetical protein
MKRDVFKFKKNDKMKKRSEFFLNRYKTSKYNHSNYFSNIYGCKYIFLLINIFKYL